MNVKIITSYLLTIQIALVQSSRLQLREGKQITLATAVLYYMASVFYTRVSLMAMGQFGNRVAEFSPSMMER